METADWTSENIEKIGELFPNVITEARGEDGELKKAINFEACARSFQRMFWKEMKPTSSPGWVRRQPWWKQ